MTRNHRSLLIALGTILCLAVFASAQSDFVEPKSEIGKRVDGAPFYGAQKHKKGDKKDDPAPDVVLQSGPRLKFRIAINQGKWQTLQYQNYSIDANAVRALQAKIIEKLQSTGMFEIMERERNSDTQSQEEADRAERRDAQQKGQGREGVGPREVSIPADYVITPEIVGFNVTAGSRGGVNAGGLLRSLGVPGQLVGDANVSGGSVKATAEISLRIFSSDTQSVLDIASGKGEHTQSVKHMDGSLLGAGVTDTEFKESPVGHCIEDAINHAVNKMVARMQAVPWRATVAGVSKTTGRITINRGMASGMAVGMEFVVLEADEPTTDPETGVLIPGDEKEIGRIRVVRVDPGACYAEVVSGTGFKAKNVVRFVKSPS